MEINRKVLIILLCLASCVLLVHADEPSDVMIIVSPDSITCDPDDVIQAGIILSSAPNGLSGYNITIQLTNPDIADIISVDFPSWAQLPKNGTLPSDSVWCMAVDLSGDSGTSDITLVNISVKAIAAGDTNITVIPTRVEDRIAGRYYPEIQNATLHVNEPPPPPIADFTYISECPDSLFVQFTDTSSNNPTSWFWNFGDGSWAWSSPTKNHTYLMTGTYNVTLTVSNEFGSDSISKDVYVSECPVPLDANFIYQSECPDPLCVNFTDISTGNINSWYWIFGDGTTSTLQNPHHCYSLPGIYTVNLSVSGPDHDDFTSRLIQIQNCTLGWKFRSDLSNSGVYDDGGVRPEGALIWSYPTSWQVDSSPAIANGVVYVGSGDGYIYALEATSGTLIWRYPTGGSVHSSPAVANGVVYVGSYDGKIYALNELTGEFLWSYTTGEWIRSSPAVANGVVYVGSGDGNIYALDAVAGTPIWTYPTGSFVYSSPAVANGVVYVGSDNGNIYALDAAAGTPIWSYPTGSSVESSPAVANGVVYIGNTDGDFYALDAQFGTVIWSITTTNCWGIEASPAVANGVVYVGYVGYCSNPNIYLFALDADSGTAIWSYNMKTSIGSSPAVANGVVYVGSYDGKIYALNELTGEFLWSYTTGEWIRSSPAVSNGVVYVASGDGNIYALGLYPDIPPDSVTDLHSISTHQDQINWTWIDPTFPKFSHVMVYVDGVFRQNVTKGIQEFTASNLTPFTSYTISTRTVSTTGLINDTWVNNTSSTLPLPPLANFTTNTTIGQMPLPIQFTDNSTGEAITNRLWLFADGGTSTDTNPVHVYTTSGLFTVTLQVTNDGGSNTHTKTNFIRVFDATPIADFIAEPQSGDAPLSVQFYDTSVGLPTGWQWNFGDGTTTTLQSPSHTYTSPGNYTVSLTAGSSGGTNTTVKADFIRVSSASPTEVPSANFTADIWTGRFSGGADFYDTSTGNPDSWNWSFGDGSYSEERTPWHYYQGIGSYPVSLTVSNSEGSDTITRDDFIVIPTPPPEADFSGSPRYGTFPLMVQFTDYSVGSVDWDTLPATYEWNFGDGSPNSTEKGTVYHHYMAAGTYNVTLTVTDIGGSDTLMMVNYIGEAPPPQPRADFTATPKYGFAPLTVDFIDQSVGSPLLTYTWDLGDGNTSYEKDPSHTYMQPGFYNVSLMTTNIGGSDTITKAGFIEVLPAPAVLPLHADFTSNVTTGMMPITVQFLDASTGDPSSWSWVFEKDSYYPVGEVEARRPVPVFGNELSHEKDPVVTYTYPGNYSVSLTVSRTGETDTITKDEYIRISPPAPVVDFNAYPQEGNAPLEVEVWENVPYAWYYDEFLWDFGDGTSGTGTWLYHTYDAPGLYNITLTVNSAYGSNSTTKTNFINVTQSLPPVPDFTGSPLSGNAPLDVVFTDISTGIVTSRVWDFGDGTVAWENETATVTHSYLIPGTYTITLTSGNDAGSASTTKTEYVQVNPSGAPPDARFSLTPRMGNAPLAVQFTDRSTGTPLKWLWDFGDGTTSSEQNPSHTYTTPGRYMPKLTVYNSGGSDTSSSFVWIRSMKVVFPTYTPSPTVTVPPTVPPEPGKSPISFFAINKSFGSAPMTVQFTDKSFNNPTSWQWDFGDGHTSTVRNPVNTFADPGTYSVSLTVNNAMGESRTSRTVYVR